MARSGVAALIAATALTAAPAARADDVEACATASERGQELRDRGGLLEARALFVQCAAAACPAIIQKDCAAWLAAVDERMPTVVLRARDEGGHDVADVRVAIDERIVAERLDGRALSVDPGTRTFRFTKAGAPDVTRALLVREGEKGRIVDVVVGAPRSAADGRAADGPRSFTIPPAAWSLGAVSIAGFGAMAGFGVSARSAVDDMRGPGGCAPRCDPDRVDAARRDMILANVMLGVGAASLVTAAVWIVIESTSPRKATPTTAARAPLLRGAAGLSGVSISASW